MAPEEREQERQQSLNAARGACEWLKCHMVHTTREPLEGPILLLIKGFEILDEKEREQGKKRDGEKGKGKTMNTINEPDSPGRRARLMVERMQLRFERHQKKEYEGAPIAYTPNGTNSANRQTL